MVAQKVDTANLLEKMLFEKAQKSPNIWSTFVRKFA